MRSFPEPLFSSSCKAWGQEAIHSPLAHTHLHLEASHAHSARPTSPRQLVVAFPGNSSSRGCREGQRLRQSHREGTRSRAASWHLLHTSCNVSVASTAFITRGAEWLWEH